VAGLLLFARRPGRYAPGLAWAARVGLGRPNSAADALFLPTSSGPQGRWVGFWGSWAVNPCWCRSWTRRSGWS